MKDLITNPDKWYDRYDALETFDTQRDFLLDTFQQELSGEFLEKSGIKEMVFEFVDELFIHKKDHRLVFSFLEKFEDLQPELYKSKFHYIEHYIVDYHLFCGTSEGINDVVKFYSENPNQDIDLMLQFYEKIRYWGLNDISVKIAEQVYEPIKKYDGYIGAPEIDFAVTVYCADIQKAYEDYLKTGMLNINGAKNRGEEFDMKETAYITFENSIKQPLNAEHLWQSSSEKADYIWDLRMYFFQYAHSKGFSFITVTIIWEEIVGFWLRNARKPNSADQLFWLPYHGLSEFISGKRFIFSPMVLKICTTLWGLPFIYDFLHANKVISDSIFQEAQKTINTLKPHVVKAFYKRLWEASYIHRVWPKPDSVPAEVYDAEKTIFEASFEYKEDFNTFKTTHKEAFNILPEYVIPRIGERKRQDYKKKERTKRNPANDAARKLRKKQKKKTKKKKR